MENSAIEAHWRAKSKRRITKQSKIEFKEIRRVAHKKIKIISIEKSRIICEVKAIIIK